MRLLLFLVCKGAPPKSEECLCCQSFPVLENLFTSFSLYLNTYPLMHYEKRKLVSMNSPTLERSKSRLQKPADYRINIAKKNDKKFSLFGDEINKFVNCPLLRKTFQLLLCLNSLRSFYITIK